MTLKKRNGRPRKDDSDEEVREKPLYKLLVERLPERFVQGGEIRITLLADAIGYNRYTIYRWMHGTPMKVASARKLIDLSEAQGGSITKNCMQPFTITL